MEFHRRFPGSPPPLSRDSIASDRLKKAIERNRRKQAKREIPPPPLGGPKVEPRPLPLKHLPLRPPPLSPSPRETFSKDQKNSFFQDLLIKVAWFFCGFLCLRLIVSEGGVLDYAAQRTLWESRSKKHESILSGNKRVAGEIDKIKKDTQYQKRLVRDHLGFIAPDEYLVLFAKEKRKTSTSRSSPP